MLDKLFKKTGSLKAVNKRKGNPFEQHAEKIVLGVSAILSLWLVWAFVISSPNAVEIDGRKLKPGDVDRHIKTKADRLEVAINEPPRRVPAPQDFVKEFLIALNCPIDNVPDFEIKMPGPSDKVFEEKRLYAVPVVGGVDKVAAAAIRGAAHIPIEEVGMDNPYPKAMTELGDIDLVTVEGNFDIAALYRGFKQSFSLGRGLKTEWRDEELAVPVFASAQVQRRRLLDGGGWSEWEVVERPKIDKFKAKMNIPENMEDVRYDIGMLKAQYKSLEFQQNVLQPDPYDFASANAVWLSPSFRGEYVELEDRQKKEAKRAELERIRDERDRSRGGYGNTRTRSRGALGGAEGRDSHGGGTADMRTRRTGSRVSGGGRLQGRGAAGAGGRLSGRGAPGRGGRDMGDGRGDYDYEMYGDELLGGRRERDLDDVIADNAEVLIDERTQLEDMREPLVFWAHDDTAAPGNTYQYRIRLGVFNPIAGKNWFASKDEQYKNQVILWSDFSDVTESIEIAPMVHFFPTDMARSREKGVQVQVAKYHLGNWRSENFEVHPGEMIGKEVDFKPAGAQAARGRGYDEYEEMMGYGTANTMPEKIDFGTGAMLVDIVKIDRWTGIRSLARSQMADVLYTTDGITMMHLPVRRNNWSNTMKAQYAKIEDAASEEVKLNQGRGQNPLKKARSSGYMGRPGMRPMMDERGYGMMEGRGERSRY